MLLGKMGGTIGNIDTDPVPKDHLNTTRVNGSNGPLKGVVESIDNAKSGIPLLCWLAVSRNIFPPLLVHLKVLLVRKLGIHHTHDGTETNGRHCTILLVSPVSKKLTGKNAMGPANVGDTRRGIVTSENESPEY